MGAARADGRRTRDFRTLWAGQAAARMGIEITRLSFPFVAVVGLHGSPTQVTAVMAVQYSPSLLFGLAVGAWVDRADRRVLLAAAGFGRCTMLALVALLVLAGVLSFPVLYGAAFLVGVCTMLHEVSYQSVLPQLVDARDLVTANGRMEASRSVAAAVGPLAGGALIQVVTAAGALAVDSVLHAAAACCALRLRRTALTRRAGPGSLRTELAEGLRTALRRPDQFRLTVVAVVVYLVTMAVTSLYVLYGARVAHLSALVIGVTFAAGAGGAVTASMAMRRVSTWSSPRTAIVAGLAIVAAGYLLIALVPPRSAVVSALTMSVGSALAQAGVVLVAAQAMAWRQRITPVHLLGRVISVSRVVAATGVPLGAVLAGPLTELIGVRMTLALAALALLVTGAWLAIPEAAHPEATRPEATGPEATRPEATGPEATRPEATRFSASDHADGG